MLMSIEMIMEPCIVLVKVINGVIRLIVMCLVILTRIWFFTIILVKCVVEYV